MRSVQRNKQTFYYALRTGQTEQVDEYNNKTGSFTLSYSSPVKAKMNISAPKGTIDLERFGLNSNYTKVISTTDMDFPIAEDSILWIGITPDANGESGTVKHNYVVVRIAPTLNQLLIMVKEVAVS